jgi:hypothetical protein
LINCVGGSPDPKRKCTYADFTATTFAVMTH